MISKGNVRFRKLRVNRSLAKISGVDWILLLFLKESFNRPHIIVLTTVYWVQIVIILNIYWLYCTKRLPVQNCVVKINIQLDQGYIKIYQQAFVKDPGYRSSMNDTGRVRLENFSQSMLIAHFFVSSTIRFFFQNGVHVHARCDTVFFY